jgi:hypothetical protein
MLWKGYFVAESENSRKRSAVGCAGLRRGFKKVPLRGDVPRTQPRVYPADDRVFSPPLSFFVFISISIATSVCCIIAPSLFALLAILHSLVLSHRRRTLINPDRRHISQHTLGTPVPLSLRFSPSGRLVPALVPVLPFLLHPPSPPLHHHIQHKMERYDSARFDIARIIGDPFALATISISIVSVPAPLRPPTDRPARLAHRLRELDN